MITQTAEYALRAITHLALDPESASTTARIAEATLVPPGYLAKIMKSLGRAGVVRSRRGPSGGFQLARPPEGIPVLDVIEAVSPLPRIRSCPLGITEHTELCPLHRLLDDAMADVERAFRSVMVSDLVASTRGQGVLCREGQRLVQLNTPARDGTVVRSRPRASDGDAAAAKRTRRRTR